MCSGIAKFSIAKLTYLFLIYSKNFASRCDSVTRIELAILVLTSRKIGVKKETTLFRLLTTDSAGLASSRQANEVGLTVSLNFFPEALSESHHWKEKLKQSVKFSLS